MLSSTNSQTFKTKSASSNLQAETHRVVCWQVRWLVGPPVRQVQPAPAGHQQVLTLDVTVAHTPAVGLCQGLQQLIHHPALVEGTEEVGVETAVAGG